MQIAESFRKYVASWQILWSERERKISTSLDLTFEIIHPIHLPEKRRSHSDASIFKEAGMDEASEDVPYLQARHSDEEM